MQTLNNFSPVDVSIRLILELQSEPTAGSNLQHNWLHGNQLYRWTASLLLLVRVWEVVGLGG